MNRMPVALFGSRPKAEPILQRLVENGIQAEIHDELWLEKLWFVARSPVVRIEAPANQFERACQLLLERSTEILLREAIRCPECKSLRIEYPQCTHKSFIPNLFVGFMAALGQVNHEFYCQDCHFTWPREGSRPSKLRPHMAPYYFIEGVEQTSSTRPKHDSTAARR